MIEVAFHSVRCPITGKCCLCSFLSCRRPVCNHRLLFTVEFFCFLGFFLFFGGFFLAGKQFRGMMCTSDVFHPNVKYKCNIFHKTTFMLVAKTLRHSVGVGPEKKTKTATSSFHHHLRPMIPVCFYYHDQVCRLEFAAAFCSAR